MKITLTIETGSGGTNLGYAKEGEPIGEQEEIMFAVILDSLNLAVERMAGSTPGNVKCLSIDARSIGTHN